MFSDSQTFFDQFRKTGDQLNSYFSRRIDIPAYGYRGTYGDLSIIALAYFESMRHCNDIPSFILPVLTMVKNLCMKPYTFVVSMYGELIVYIVKMCFSSVTKCFEDFNKIIFPMTAQSSDLASVRDFLSRFQNVIKDKDRIINSEFSARVCNFASLIICLPFFRNNNIDSTWFGFTKIFDQSLMHSFSKKHPMSIYDGILDGTLFILEKSITLLETGSLKSLYVEDRELVAFEEEFNFLSYYYDRLDLVGNHDLKLDDYLRRSDACRNECKRLMSFCSQDKFQLNTLKAQYAFLGRCIYRVNDKLKTTSEREPPLAFVLFGSPGIGKSAIIDKLLTICYQNAKVLGRSDSSYDVKMKYHYNHSDEYMSEFRVSHEICIVDDVDQFQDKIMEMDAGGALKHTIDFINPVPYITNQAELANKGMIPFMCKYVVMTTNTFDAGVSKVFRPGGGARRRFLFFDIKVKDEYCHPGSTQLKGDPSNDYNHELHDYYPRRYVSVGDAYNEEYWNHDDKKWQIGKARAMSLAEIAVFLRDEIQAKHYRQNDVARSSIQNFIDSKICEKCRISCNLCGCAEAQGSRLDAIGALFDTVDMKLPFSRPMNFYYFTFYLNMMYTFTIISTFFVFDFFGYRSNFLLDKIIQQIVVCNKYYEVLMYFPKSIQRYVFIYYWSENFKLNSMFMNKYKASLYGIYGISIIVTLIAMAKMYLSLDHIARLPVNGSTVTKVEAKEKPWKISYKDVSRLKGPQSTVTMDQLVNIVQYNLLFVVIRVKANTFEFFTRGLGLYGNTIVLPAHNFVRTDSVFFFEIDIIRCEVDKKLGPNRFAIKICSNCITYSPDQDLLFVTHPSFGTFRDIRKYFKNDMEGIASGQILMRNPDGAVRSIPYEGIQRVPIAYYCNETNYNTMGYRAYLKEITAKGDCGSPYLVQAMNGCFIAGIHIAGGEHNRYFMGYCLPVNIPEIKVDLMEAHSFDGINLQDSYQTSQDLSYDTMLHNKDPINDLEGVGLVYGTLRVPRVKPHTDVCHTIMCEDVLKKFDMLDVNYFSPSEVSSRQATLNNLEKMVIKPNIDIRKLIFVSKGLYKWYSATIRKYKLQVPNGPYNILVGINGIDEDHYINRLPANTSGGFAHKGRKDKYLVPLPSVPEHQVCFGLDENVQMEYDKLLEGYKTGLRGNVVWDFNFKDEPISAEKVRKNKCRIFNSGPLAFMVLVRQYFLWCIPLFSGPHRTEFGMAIGANCYSTDWNKIYEHLVRHGHHRMIAGDYKAFDKGMSPDIMMCAFDVLFKIARDFGWTDEDLYVMRGIATDICYPLSNSFGTLIEFFGSNPSGHPLTTPINGMCNILYIMVAVYDIVENKNIKIDYSNFLDHVSIITYGDDNCMSSKHVEINHTSISLALGMYGIEYTMADKSSESKPFINIYDVEFLKRKFRPNVNKEGLIAAPLAEDSIIKSLTVCTRSRTITFKQQCAEIIDAANREYFQYGKKRFNKMHKFFLSIIDKYDLIPYLAHNNLPDYDELYNNYCGRLEAQSSDLIEYQAFALSIVAKSMLNFNFGPRLETINMEKFGKINIYQFQLLCQINNELHEVLENTWVVRISDHYSLFKHVLRDIENPLYSRFDWFTQFIWDLDLESL